MESLIKRIIIEVDLRGMEPDFFMFTKLLVTNAIILLNIVIFYFLIHYVSKYLIINQ